MNSFDVGFVVWINQFVGQYPAFDAFIVVLTRLYLFRGPFIIFLICWAYFNKNQQIIDKSLFWPKIILGEILAIGISRALQDFLPHRFRPRHEPTLEFVLPDHVRIEELQDWSSFPSDHGVVFGALAIGLFLLDRRFGWLGIIWTVLIILLPRVYIGAHYPSDLLAGVIIGSLIMLGVWQLPTSVLPQQTLMRLGARHNGLVTASLVIFLYLLSTMFDDLRFFVDRLPPFVAQLLAGSA